MSTAVKTHQYWLYNLLNENKKKQVLGILHTLDDRQIPLITEIFYNLLKLPQTIEVAKLLKRHKRLVTKLSSGKVNPKSKIKLVRKHKTIIVWGKSDYNY